MSLENTYMKQKKTQRSSRQRPPFQLEEALQRLRVHLPELHERYDVHALWLFGSYVRGEQKRGSDLDILVEFDRTPTFFDFVRLERYLSEQLGVKVDLVMKTALKSNIAHHILEEVVPV